MSTSCDRYEVCRGFYETWGPFPAPDDQLRAAGWHVYEGPSMTGKELTVRLCPECAGNGKRTKAPQVLDGQLELELGGDDMLQR